MLVHLASRTCIAGTWHAQGSLVDLPESEALDLISLRLAWRQVPSTRGIDAPEAAPATVPARGRHLRRDMRATP